MRVHGAHPVPPSRKILKTVIYTDNYDHRHPAGVLRSKNAYGNANEREHHQTQHERDEHTERARGSMGKRCPALFTSGLEPPFCTDRRRAIF